MQGQVTWKTSTHIHFMAWAVTLSYGSNITNETVAQRSFVREAEEIFVRHEAIMTRFDPVSELSQLNAQPEQWVQLSNILWEAISRAIQLAYQLNGLFDPTILATV